MVTRPLLLAALLIFLVTCTVGSQWRDDPFLAGDRAYLAGDHDEAVRQYEAALVQSPDPGLVSYHLGVAYAALGRHGEAAAAWARTLEDAQGLRRLRAAYGQATALTRIAHALPGRRAVRLLQQGLQLFDLVAREAPEVADDRAEAAGIAEDAKHNRAIAEALLANKLKEPEPPDPPEENLSRDETDAQLNSDESGPGTRPNQPSGVRRGAAGNRGGAQPEGSDTQNPGRGDPPPPTNDDSVPPLSLDEANRRLDDVLRRLQRPLQNSTTRPGAKDW